jgi:hypothetical protein
MLGGEESYSTIVSLDKAVRPIEQRSNRSTKTPSQVPNFRSSPSTKAAPAPPLTTQKVVIKSTDPEDELDSYESDEFET